MLKTSPSPFKKKGHQVKDMYIIVVWCRNTTLNTSFRCFKCRGLTSWPPDDLAELFSELLLTLLLMTELAALLGPARLTVPWLELELGVGLWGPWGAFLSSLLAVSEEVEPELTPDELWMTRFFSALTFYILVLVKLPWRMGAHRAARKMNLFYYRGSVNHNFKVPPSR